MSDTEIFEFNIAGDQFLEETLSLAMKNWASKDNIKIYGWREASGVLYFYNTKLAHGIQIFPAPLQDVDAILPLVTNWLKQLDWDTKSQYSDVVYHRGFRVYNTISYEEMNDRYGIVFAVKPHWTEYHK